MQIEQEEAQDPVDVTPFEVSDEPREARQAVQPLIVAIIVIIVLLAGMIFMGSSSLFSRL